MSSPFEYLSSLKAVRDRSTVVYEAAERGETANFDLHKEKLDEAADYVANLILDSFSPAQFDQIPPHGRWQHFEVEGQPRLGQLLEQWQKQGVDSTECTRRLIDIFTVSVLLDAGSGDFWKFTEPSTGLEIRRSEGLAVASFYMFKDGAFSSGSGEDAFRVDGAGLKKITPESLAIGMQSSPENPLTGVQGRADLLKCLGDSLLSNPEIFGPQGRPGNLVDHLLSKQKDSSLDVAALWSALQILLLPIWPKDRTCIEGQPIGDAWPLSTLEKIAASKGERKPYDNIQPFHKLTQWLAYSLMVPFVRLLGLKWAGNGLLTGLPEYRNGGLFVDLGVISLKKDALERGCQKSGQDLPLFSPSDDVIVEWRALTVSLLDRLHPMVNARLAQKGATVELSLAQVLEAGSWKAGRTLAAKYRPSSKSSPILIESDGTLF
ncbi:DUF1688-domain-containing protein [Xylona heveae TC161]|uniref:DUF1688-domain-containing protein n=1 Tax=Xylona heveae (strain CBS 132557 / TC161) TaxID=1328760 RepID=A0A165HQC4_XYLHT|nr:DUF1688-domain-containing protein [Xylona heveae TC161]KZF23829.1 DUF1688-domain-containing protein [Xylona heveae TC161]